MKPGDYVKVIAAPDPWEGAGESDSDRISLLGHVGIIVEVEPPEGNWGYECALVRFPHVGFEITGQRNIELRCLELVSSPAVQIAEAIFDLGDDIHED